MSVRLGIPGRPEALCLHDLVAARAEKEAVAVVAAGTHLSYGELLRRAAGLAARLRAHGVGPETRVALCLERSPELVVGVLGILASGGAFVPLAPSDPERRRRLLLEDSGAPAVVTSWRRRHEVSARAVAVCPDDPKEPATPSPAAVRADPAAAAYVLYTSGSTGRPKGVVVSHQAAVAYLRWAVEAYGLERGRGAPVHTGIGFDLTLTSLFGPLLAGRTVLLLPEGDAPAALADWLEDAGGWSLLKLTPTHLEVLGQLAAGRPLSPPRVMVVGGEALSAAGLAFWRRRAPGLTIVNEYGPTEAVVGCTASVVGARPAAGAVPIGRAVAAAAVHLLDRHLRRSAPGAPGELGVGGAGLARGYLDRPAETAVRFLPDPFSGHPGGRLYRTGDRACRRRDGELVYLGRLDEQVKIRGHRVEPGEVEARLRRRPGVREAAVVASRDPRGETRLVAYLTAGPGASPGVAELRRDLGRVLPAYSVPAAFVVLESMPLMPHGKVDRPALRRRPLPAAAGASAPVTAPRTPLEGSLAALWSELLGRGALGVDEDVFDLGGHSLLAIRFAARLRAERRLELPVDKIFERPTVAAQAAWLEASSMPAAGPPPRARTASEGPLPLSFSQERVWFLHRLYPGNLAYNSQSALRFRGRLAPSLLRRALAEVVRRHEVLYTSFPELDGRPVQVVHRPWVPRLPLADLSALPEARREPEARRQLLGLGRRPFEPDRLPLARWTLLRLGAREHLLFHGEHHLIHDGWSFNVFLGELAALYRTFESGAPAPPAPPIQFADYALWQRRGLEGAMADQLRYWKARLAGCPEHLALPADRPRPTVPRFRGAAPREALREDLVAALRALGRRHGATLFMTLFTAFAVLLRRLTGQDDLCVGSGVANRRWRESEPLLGMLINNVVLRADCGGDPGFTELLGRLGRLTREAYAHQDLPFDRLVQALGRGRNLSHNPLFQVAFAFHDAPWPDLALPDLTVDVHEALGNGTAKFDLAVTVIPSVEQRSGRWDGGGETTVVWEYSSDLFDATTVARMMGQYRAVLSGVLADPARRAAEIPVQAAAERHQLLLEWNDRGRELGAGTLVEMFGSCTARVPDAVAVTAGRSGGPEPQLTYRELERRAALLGRRLARRGVGEETVVGILMERSLEMVIGMLGVLEAGGAYLPLDPSHPAERLAFQISEAGVPVLLTAGRQPRLGGRRTGGRRTGGRRPRGRRTGGANLAYLLFTSGSTGRPKGVAVSQDAIAHHMRWMQAARPLGASDRVLQKTPFAFDASVWEFWAPLLAGARLVLAPPEAHRAADEVAAAVMRHEVTVLQVVPALLRALLDSPVLGRCRALRRVYCGGEPLSARLVARFAAAAPAAAELLNVYGPTEATIHASFASVRPPGERRTAAIGRPIANTRLHLLGRDMRPVPLGASGVLHIAGRGVARGYLGRPALTAAAFLPDPWTRAPGGRLYDSGDVARYLGDGALEVWGRRDRQVKVRGVRVEPGEVEAALERHPDVRGAAVVAPAAVGERRLVAWILRAGGTDPRGLDADRLRRFLRRRLPEAMVPAAFYETADLPLTPSGKVDRAALAEAAAGRADSAREIPGRLAAGADLPVREVLAEIWREVLDLAAVGPHDDFFALGGHSLLATGVLARVRRVLGVDLPLRCLFDHPTVARLAERCEAALRKGPGPSDEPPLRVRGPVTGRRWPMSPAQWRLWFLERLTAGSGAYNTTTAISLEGDLEVSCLVAALAEIVRRHAVLRTRFPTRGERPAQWVEPALAPPFTLVDCGALGPAARGAAAAAIAGTEAARPFDLERGPLLRGHLLRLGVRRHVLLLHLHHIVCDGWSLGVLYRELAWLYEHFLRGEPPRLPELGVQYAHYAVWQRRRWPAIRGRSAGPLRRLEGAPSLELPVDRPRPERPGQRGGALTLELPAPANAALRRLARDTGTSHHMVRTAAFLALLHRQTAQRDLVVGVPAANRPRPELEALVGCFVNLLVLRVDLGDDSHPGGPTVRELLGRVREASLAAYAHQDFPFERLVEELKPRRDLARHPLVQAVLASQRPLPPVELAALTLRPVELRGRGNRRARFGLELHAWDEGEDLRGAWLYAADLFDATTIARLAHRFLRLAEGLAADPSRRLDRLPLLAAAERHQLLSEWNDRRAAYPSRHGLYELFAAQADRCAEAVALVEERAGAPDLHLSYRELRRRAACLGRRLRASGIVTEERVGLFAEPSAASLAGLLGILAAGGVYVPLDPAHPRERLSFLLADSGARVVLVQEDLWERMPPRGGRWPLAGSSRASGRPFPPASRQPAHPLQLAYVMYTSGSTGRPKGVAVAHRAVARLALGNDFARLASGTAVLQLAPLAFDASTFEIWGPLLHGGRLVAPASPRPALAEIGELLRRHRVDTLWLTAGLFHLLADAEPEALGALRQLLAGGDVLSPARVRRVLAALAGGALVNGYGPTESTTFACCHRMRSTAGTPSLTVPIGRPIRNTRTHVVNGCLRPSPAGVAGELVIGGDGLARGYWRRAALTARRFVPDPFSAAPGERLYRSGDRVRRRGDGVLEFLGRLDRQVKIRGFRVEPGEVEASLRRHPAVRDAAVVAAGGGDVRHLVAHFVPADGNGGTVGGAALRSFLRRRLPEAMVPAAFVRRAALPLDPRGKLDRGALAEAGPGRAGPHRAAPNRTAGKRSGDRPRAAGVSRSAAERAVADLWREVLRRAEVGLDDNFFDVGGHSLLLLRLHHRLCARFGRPVPLVEMFRHPTVRSLAAHLDGETLDGETLDGETPQAPAPPGAAAGRRRQRNVLSTMRRSRRLHRTAARGRDE